MHIETSQVLVIAPRNRKLALLLAVAPSQVLVIAPRNRKLALLLAVAPSTAHTLFI